ncbi:MAG: sel1 repeat family protein [Magnetococcales bacterium]|nr:sel1 repeat family protein [Magnetococcales bacterium]
MTDLDFGRCCSARLLVAVAFHYREERLGYLATMLSSLFAFPVNILHVVVMTNTENPAEMEAIQAICHPLFSASKNAIVQPYSGLEDPFMLTWCFRPLLQELFLAKNASYTHFIYLEDDIELSFLNFCYFVSYRDLLQAHNLIPAFVRVEFNDSIKKHVSTDNWYQTELDKGKKIACGDYYFVDLTNPYMAMFIMDRALAEEYVASPSSDCLTSRSIVSWGIREQAAMGLTFENVPPGFMSRYVVPISMTDRMAPLCSWIYHLPNNLANYPNTPNGKLPMAQLVVPAEVSLLRVRARQGDLEAQLALGQLYADGKQVPKNLLEATHWYLKAANQGNHAAQLALGALYAIGGPGVQADFVLAYMWSRLATRMYAAADNNIQIMVSMMEQEQIAQAESMAADWRVGEQVEIKEQFYPWHGDAWWTPHMEAIKRRADEWRRGQQSSPA